MKRPPEGAVPRWRTIDLFEGWLRAIGRILSGACQSVVRGFGLGPGTDMPHSRAMAKKRNGQLPMSR